jgi:hypothetical protein
MEDILLPASRHTPLVDFRFSQHRLEMRGELYPENAALFFGPLMERVRTYLDRDDADPLNVVLDLLYMNSASTKKLFQLVGMLADAAATGRAVAVEFDCDADNEMIGEFVADLVDDFPGLSIRLATKAV